MNIVNISSVFPSPCKENENDVILTTAHEHSRHFKGVKHFFLLTIPYANKLTEGLSPKFNCYSKLRKRRKYLWKNIEIHILPVFVAGQNRLIRSVLNYITYKRYRRYLLRLMNELKPDLIHAHNVQSDAYIARQLSKELKVPYVITSRAIHLFKKSKQVGDNLKTAKAVISINYDHKKLVETIIGKENSYLLPHGITDNFFKYNSNQINNKSAKIPRIITVSRLLDWKNIDKVLYALCTVKSDFVYHIYGDGPEYTRLRSIIEDLSIRDKIELKGHIDYNEVPKVMADAAFFILLSYPETFGRVFFEAMAVGLPVIASKGSGVAGYLEDGESCYLVDRTNIQEVSKTIEHLLLNIEVRNEMGAKAKELANKYSWRGIVNQLHEIYLN